MGCGAPVCRKKTCERGATESAWASVTLLFICWSIGTNDVTKLTAIPDPSLAGAITPMPRPSSLNSGPMTHPIPGVCHRLTRVAAPLQRPSPEKGLRYRV